MSDNFSDYIFINSKNLENVNIWRGHIRICIELDGLICN